MKQSLQSGIKNLLFTGILGLLFLPMLQQLRPLIIEKPLKGAIEQTENPYVSYKDWKVGIYQEKTEAYVNQHFGFRNPLVRLNNQLYFSFFHQAKANGVVIGKENYLYEENYIKACLGRDFIGDSAIRQEVMKFRKVSDMLKKKGKSLVVLLAPGKASFYPEYIPANFHPESKTTTNYEVYRKLFEENSIHLLDFNAWFRSMKQTAAYPLFPKTGIHWSKYGEFIAADSLVRYIAKLRHLTTMPKLVLDSIQLSNIPEDTDDDVEQGMNILENIPDLPMAYPRFHVQKNATTDQTPTVLTIADSYYWGMFGWGISRDFFNNGQFWFYNEQIYPDSFNKPVTVSEIDIRREAEKNDVILIISTDANLYKFPFGFIDQLYEKYFPEKKTDSNTP